MASVAFHLSTASASDLLLDLVLNAAGLRPPLPLSPPPHPPHTHPTSSAVWRVASPPMRGRTANTIGNEDKVKK
jgi:hypothetical protein